jgi:hypothetical protein
MAAAAATCASWFFFKISAPQPPPAEGAAAGAGKKSFTGAAIAGNELEKLVTADWEACFAGGGMLAWSSTSRKSCCILSQCFK